MWHRMLPSALPTPLHTGDVRRKTVREQLLDEDEDDTRPPPPKKRAHYSMHPLFDKCKRHKNDDDDDLSTDRLRLRRRNRLSPSPVSESPLIQELKHNYATLRVTLHSNGVKDVAKTEAALTAEADKKINANISKLNKIASKARQLCASSLDCEVDTLISNKDGKQITRTVQVRKALLMYQELQDGRSQQLSELWNVWEKNQAEIDDLSNKVRELFGREPPKGTSGMSSNCEWAENEDLDIERRIKQVVDDMIACEDEFHEKLKDEQSNILEAMINCSLG
ncbi:hypothetical protein F4802DRAFT_518788 [Xylaria palmicola]|nr:hypothetical protein F4802DRAFT_518788 [Xylaria palmicola]